MVCCGTKTRPVLLSPDSDMSVENDVQNHDDLVLQEQTFDQAEYQDHVTSDDQNDRTESDNIEFDQLEPGEIRPDQFEPDDVTLDQKEPDTVEPDQTVEDLDGFVEDDKTSVTEVNVHIASWPSGAQLNIDGESVGDTPMDVVVTVGTHHIIFNKPPHHFYEDDFEIDETTTEISVMLEEDPKVPVYFYSETPDVEDIEVCITSVGCDITPFTVELYINTDYPVDYSKEGYEEEHFDLEVGAEPMEISIVLDPLNFDTYCGWLPGEYEQIEGTITVENNVTVAVEILEDHCTVCGFEPPASPGLCLFGNYMSDIHELFLECPHPDFCSFILCHTFPEFEIVDCTYEDNEGEYQEVQWQKII